MVETALLMGNTLCHRPSNVFGLFSNRVHCTVSETHDAEPENFPDLEVTYPGGIKKAITIELTCRALPEDKQTITKDLLFGELYQVRLEPTNLSIVRLTIDDCLKFAIPEDGWETNKLKDMTPAKKIVCLFPWAVTGKPIKDDPASTEAFNNAIRTAYANHATRTAPHVGSEGIEAPLDNETPKVIELLPNYLALVSIGTYPDAENNPTYLSFYFSSYTYNEMYRTDVETDVLLNLRRYCIGDHIRTQSRFTEAHVRMLFLQFIIDDILEK